MRVFKDFICAYNRQASQQNGQLQGSDRPATRNSLREGVQRSRTSEHANGTVNPSPSTVPETPAVQDAVGLKKACPADSKDQMNLKEISVDSAAARS